MEFFIGDNEALLNEKFSAFETLHFWNTPSLSSVEQGRSRLHPWRFWQSLKFVENNLTRSVKDPNHWVPS